MKSFLYIINRFRTANLLNLLGLTVAFAAFYLFMTQVQFTRQYNEGLYHHQDLFRLEATDPSGRVSWMANNPRPLVEHLYDLPQVEDVYMYQNAQHDYIVIADNEITCHYTNILPGSLKALHPVVLDGKLDMLASDDVILSESLAMIFFHTTQAVGKQIKVANGKTVNVVGVIQDFPENCVVRNGIFVNLDKIDQDNLDNWNYNCLVYLHPGTDIVALANHLKEWYIERRLGYNLKDATPDEIDEVMDYFKLLNFRLIPISKTYMSGVDPNEDKGNQGMLIVLSLACILVIVVAAINFTNFTLAQTPVRIKGINTRKVLGQSLASLRLGMVAEGVCISLTAWVLAMVLCLILNAIPDIQSAFLGSLVFTRHIDLFMLTLFIALLVGVLASIYPAWYATSFVPALVLKGAFGLSPRGIFLRKLLVGVQITIAIIMICYIGILALQSRYIYRSDYGFDKDQILVTILQGQEAKKKKQSIREEVMKLPGVENTCFSQFIPGVEDLIMWWGRGTNDKTVYFYCLPVDWHFLSTYGIPVIEGRDFRAHDGDTYIINQTMKNEYDWIEIDKVIIDGDLPVNGVCRNFRLFSMRKSSSTPTAFIIYGDRYQWNDSCNKLSIRVSPHADKIALKKQIEAIINAKLNNQSAQVDLLDQLMDNTYKEEFRFIRQVDVFSVICFIITLIGVFCLTMFETEYRRKEIGVRRVLGSHTFRILVLFNRQYLMLTLLGFAIAIPVSYHMGNEWLTNFADHTEIYWWLFPLSLFIVGTVTVLTVSIQSWRVAHENPVNSIKNE